MCQKIPNNPLNLQKISQFPPPDILVSSDWLKISKTKPMTIDWCKCEHQSMQNCTEKNRKNEQKEKSINK